jgi:Zn-dependent peptidase ImmA (M78 family)
MRATRKKYIRALVQDLLTSHSIPSPPVPVEEIARALGADIQRRPAEDDLSGFLLRDNKEQRAVIGVNSKHPQNRQRFTIAHELGHFLLHETEKMHVDREDRGFQVKLRSKGATSELNVEEREANLFAAELLMPAVLLEKDLFLENDVANIGDGFDLLNEKVLLPLARRYRVSSQALTFRLAYLGYIQL